MNLIFLTLMDIIQDTTQKSQSLQNSGGDGRFPWTPGTDASILSCDHSSVSAMCTGRVECSLEATVGFTHRTLA